MKTKFTIVTLVLMLSSIFATKAQTLESKYGVDSIQTTTNASLYGETLKQKNYSEAITSWRYVFNNAPKFQKRIYTDGVKIMRGMIKTTRKPAYIDTLMMVYDQRIKYFGNDKRYPEGYILGRKAGDLFAYKKKNISAVKEAYGIFNKSIELRGNKSEITVLNKTMEAAKILVLANEIPQEEVIDKYLQFMEISNVQIAALEAKTQSAKVAKSLKNTTGAKTNIENMFFASGVADCETLNNIFTPKFEANPDDLVQINKILKLLNRQECEDLPLYAMVAERKYELEPNADAAHNLAKMFLKKKDLNKSKAYFNKAIELEQSEDVLAGLHYKLAMIQFAQGQLSACKSNALKAAKYRPNWGAPYITIGKAYASYSSKYGSEPIDHQAVYWVAVDKFAHAKRIDPECAADANKLIATYSQHFPGSEEAFFHSLIEGNTYKVKDWINETTKIRFNR